MADHFKQLFRQLVHSSSPATEFPPLLRTPAESQTLLDPELLAQCFEVVNEIVLILNRQRQIVFYNSHFARLLGHPNRQNLIGLRPGEAIGCIYACEVGGCGTSEFCSTCGAVQAILQAQQGKADVKECRVLRGPQSEAMDLRVRTTPLEFRGEEFTVFAASDISHEKRRNALERVFFTT